MGIFKKAAGVAAAPIVGGGSFLSGGIGGKMLGSIGGGIGEAAGGLYNSVFGPAIAARNAALERAAASLDPGEKPGAAKWSSLLDEKTGRLIDPYQLGLSGTAYGKVLEKMRADAYRDPSEKSPEQLVLEQQLALEQQKQLGDATMEAARQAAEGRASLASKRGLSGAASERLAKSSGRDASRMMQNIRATGADRALGIQGQELANRRDIFNRLAGMEGDVETKNIKGALEEVGSQREKAQRDYEEQMRAWAAAKQGQATILAGKGSKK